MTTERLVVSLPRAMSDHQSHQRHGKNLDGYRGETIEIGAVLDEMDSLAARQGWAKEDLWQTGDSRANAYVREARGSGPRVYISAGIHGDEPAGPLAVAQMLREDRWPGDLSVWLCPCLNPAGFRLNRRENARGHDLNRQYLHRETDETRAHIAWLERQPPFDLTLCLHEDWEALGFYLYELNPDGLPSLAEEMIRRVAEVCPIDHSPLIEGREAHAGIIRPDPDPDTRPQWPEAFYLLRHKTRLTYTLEAPSDYALPVRVAALVTAVRVALESLSG